MSAHTSQHTGGDKPSSSQLDYLLESCSFGYHTSDQYSFVFKDERAAKKFHLFIEDQYKHRKSHNYTPRLDPIGMEGTTFYTVKTTVHKWKTPDREPGTFEWDVNVWAVDHPKRWITAPSPEELGEAFADAAGPKKKTRQ